MPPTKHRATQPPKPTAKANHPAPTPSIKAEGPLYNPISRMGYLPGMAARLGDNRFAAAQRQTIATQTGQQIGNQGITRLIHRHLSSRYPLIQRAPETSDTAAPTLPSPSATVKAIIADHETLQTLNKKIDQLADFDPKKPHKPMVKELSGLRGQIPQLVVAADLGIEEDQAKLVRQHFYRQLNSLAPFYTQMANENILGTKKKAANLRTCNVSTLAMSLEGLGKTADDFKGNSLLMNNIAATFSLETNVNSLRLADFLQILAIYIRMVEQNKPDTLNNWASSSPERFQAAVDQAKAVANSDITSSARFNHFLTPFGVSLKIQVLDLDPALAVFGAYYRRFDQHLNEYIRQKKNKGEKYRPTQEEIDKYRPEFTEQRKAAYRKKGVAGEKSLAQARTELAKVAEQETARDQKLKKIAELELKTNARLAVGSETNEAELVEEVLPISLYQSAVIPLMSELLGSGKQVIVNLHEHFVKLQAISAESIIVHEPAKAEGKDLNMPWERARELGYFKRYYIVS